MTATVRDEIVRLAAAWVASAELYENARHFGTDDERWHAADICNAAETAFRAYVDIALAQAVAGERERCATWHDFRAAETPDAFEMEFHQRSAAALLALPSDDRIIRARTETQADGEKNG